MLAEGIELCVTVDGQMLPGSDVRVYTEMQKEGRGKGKGQ
jgi:hypothetical protein